MKLDRLVIGMDFSEPSLAAAKWTARHFAPAAELILAHSIEAPEPPTFLRDILPPYDEVVAVARREAERLLHEFARSVEAARVRMVMRVGRPADRVAELAREVDADLIVVAEHGHRRMVQALLGSTAEQLVRCSPVPVLLARGLTKRAPRNILVPLDESELAPTVLGWAGFLAERFAARLTAFHALDPGLYGIYRVKPSEAEARRVEEEARQRTTRWLERQAEGAGVAPEILAVRVEFGEARFEIAATAERSDAEMIVMGSRGARAVSPAFLGGVASAVLHGTRQPVLIVTDQHCV